MQDRTELVFDGSGSQTRVKIFLQELGRTKSTRNARASVFGYQKATTITSVSNVFLQ